VGVKREREEVGVREIVKGRERERERM